ncbi:unnamed protein product [Mytilus edulis]|uniref:Uncharacterized protein n=1 Tax=Mytilus edulis TaxID=6550 RepID=A0A8S3VDA7_MYTED|nr:unnamed protein product [Mytilus edulis]
MAEKPSISDSYKLPIPQSIPDAVDEITSNSPLVTATPADLDDNKKRWLVVGICLHSIIAPALRNYIKAKCDYTIKDAVELSKLFQPTYMAHYTGFDETCETNALLELFINIDKFAPDVRTDAAEVRRHLRNRWAHCDFSEWGAAKYSNAFSLMEKFVLDMNLSSNEENQTIGKLKKWEINGEQFLSGTTVGFELFNELRQQTCVLGEYARQIATGTDDNFTRINNELEKIQILLINSIDQLQKDLEEIDKRVKAQDKIIENQHTQLGKFAQCEIELWREQEVMFVETPVVKDILQIIESKHSVLIVGTWYW